MNRRFNFTLAFAVLMALPMAATAHGTGDRAKPPKASISTDEYAFGVEGDPRLATRTISMSMDDCAIPET